MWIKQPTERLLNGMPITPVACSRCKHIWRYFDKLDSRCLHCGNINDFILDEDGYMETTLPTEEELSEIEKLRKENQTLKEKLALYSMYAILYDLMDSDDEDS